jgi:hypothetical protein
MSRSAALPGAAAPLRRPCERDRLALLEFAIADDDVLEGPDMTKGLLKAVVVATVVEGPGIYFWLRWDAAGHPTAGILLLVLTGTIESWPLVYIMLIAPRDPAALRDGAVRVHLLRVRTMAAIAIPAEVMVWLAWRGSVDVVGMAAAAPLLLVLMHLKHQIEYAAVRGTRVFVGIFSVRTIVSSASEVAGAVACLALIRDGQPGRAAAALAVGLTYEHYLLLGALLREMEARDLGIPPRGDKAPGARRARVFRRRGFSNVVEFWASAHLALLWKLIEAIGPWRRSTNRTIVNRFGYRMAPRPNPLHHHGAVHVVAVLDRPSLQRPPSSAGSAAQPAAGRRARVALPA